MNVQPIKKEESSHAAKMCRDKKRYSSMIKAYCAMGRLSVMFQKNYRAYSCPICRGWHLTTQVAPKKEITMEEALTSM